MNYELKPKPGPVVEPGEFPFAAAHLDHGHIYGMCDGLIQAGGQLRYVFDTEPERVADFRRRYPGVSIVDSFERILDDPEIRLVAAAAVPSDRGPLGCRVMRAGKDYYTDKTPFISLSQLAEARKVVAETGRKYMVCYSERLQSECCEFAADLIAGNAIGRVVQVVGFGPHRLNAPSRPAWFFERAKYGGILCDIGSHNMEQILFFAGATDATIPHAAIANYSSPEYPELEDFGEASLILDNGASGYFRVDWFTPPGLSTWGDGRTLILGTKGYIELRKSVDVGHDRAGNHLFLVDEKDQRHFALEGKVGCAFPGKLILDCLNRTEHAMTQRHAFKATELSLKAQAAAVRLQ